MYLCVSECKNGEKSNINALKNVVYNACVCACGWWQRQRQRLQLPARIEEVQEEEGVGDGGREMELELELVKGTTATNFNFCSCFSPSHVCGCLHLHGISGMQLFSVRLCVRVYLWKLVCPKEQKRGEIGAMYVHMHVHNVLFELQTAG